MAHPIERLNKSQTKYERRIKKFTESDGRRTELFERARSIGQVCKSVGQPKVVLQSSESGDGTVACIYNNVDGMKRVDQDDSPSNGAYIFIDNDTGFERIDLPSSGDITELADDYGKRGATPFGVVSRAFKVRAIQGQLDEFATALDMIEEAATNPVLNPALSDAYREIARLQEITGMQRVPADGNLII